MSETSKKKKKEDNKMDLSIKAKPVGSAKGIKPFYLKFKDQEKDE
ncbi:hypothetical protein [Methanocalculus sp.]|nr:hypothetical protein [Methanocalculus sp.]MDG6251260.1 hypothetical protein [Methanocalculus sp.]